MSRGARAAVGVLYVLGCVATAIALAALLVNGSPSASSLIILTIAYLPYATVGSILVARRPRNAIGWMLIALGWVFATSFLPIRATAHELQTLTASPLVETVAWFTGWSVSLIFALFTTLAFVFPAGRLPSGRSRRVVAIVLVMTWGIVLLSAFRPVMTVLPEGAAAPVEIPNPFGFLPVSILGVLRIPEGALIPVLPFILLAAIVAIIGRYARARDLERLQLRWLVAALASITVAIPTGFALGAVFGLDAAITWIPAAVAFTLPPIAIGIAVLRYRLYEIDRLISRGLSWAVLSGLLVAVYAGAIILLQSVLGDVTQGETLAVAGSTLVAAALFQPLRRRTQATVDHRFNRARYDSERTATDFAERLRDQVDLVSLASDLDTTVRRAIAPSSVGLWLRGHDR
jgi:hypothetical protein